MVMDDPDEIAAALRGTALDGLPIEEGLGETWVVTDVEPGQLLSAWRAARAAVPQTGRWPVLTDVDEQWQEPTTEEIEVLDQEARTIDPWTVYRWWGAGALVEPENVPRWVPSFLRQDVAEQARRDLSRPTTLLAVARWTWEQLLADSTALEQAWRKAAPLVGTGCWYRPRQGVQLVLLPTPIQWLAPAWLDYFGATVVADGRGRTGL